MSTAPVLTSSAATRATHAWGTAFRARFASGAKSAVRSGTLYALGDQVVYSFGNMVVAAVLSRNCPSVQFGVYILTQRCMDVLIQLSNVFLWGPYTFHLPEFELARRGLYQGSIVFLQAVFVSVFTMLLYVATLWSSSPNHATLHATFSPLIVASGAILFREFTRRMYFAHMRLKEAFWTDVATVALQIGGVLWLLHVRDLRVSTVLYVLALAAGLVSGWWVIRDWRLWSVKTNAVYGDFRRDLELGRWFFGSNMIFLASAQCNPWVLNGVLGGSAVGTYAIAESLVNVPRVALTSMQNMMGPTLARAQCEGGRAQVDTMVRKMNAALLGISSVFAFAIWCFGPWAARLIYRRAPGDTRQIVLWLCINLVVYASTLAQSYGLTAVGRADATFFANTAGLLVQASVCLLLIRSFGVPGAAIALLIGNCGVLLSRHWIYRREMGQPC